MTEKKEPFPAPQGFVGTRPDYRIIRSYLDLPEVRPTIPIATIATRATLSILGAGNNGGINIETFPPCSDFEVVGQFYAELTEDDSGSNCYNNPSDPFPSIGLLGRNEAVCGVEHDWFPSYRFVFVFGCGGSSMLPSRLNSFCSDRNCLTRRSLLDDRPDQRRGSGQDSCDPPFEASISSRFQ